MIWENSICYPYFQSLSFYWVASSIFVKETTKLDNFILLHLLKNSGLKQLMFFLQMQTEARPLHSSHLLLIAQFFYQKVLFQGLYLQNWLSSLVLKLCRHLMLHNKENIPYTLFFMRDQFLRFMSLRFAEMSRTK